MTLQGSGKQDVGMLFWQIDRSMEEDVDNCFMLGTCHKDSAESGSGSS